MAKRREVLVCDPLFSFHATPPPSPFSPPTLTVAIESIPHWPFQSPSNCPFLPTVNNLTSFSVFQKWVDLSPDHPPSQCPERLHGPDIKSIPVPAGRHDWCSCHHRPLCNCQTAIYENGWSMGNDLSLMIMVTDSYDHGQFKKCWGPLQAFLRFYRKAVSAGKSTCFYLYCFCWRLTMGPPARLTEILQATSFRGKIRFLLILFLLVTMGPFKQCVVKQI